MSEPFQSVFELPATQPSTPRPAADSPGRALAAAARNLLPVLEAGHRLIAPIVTTAVHDAWQAVDSERASWNSKSATTPPRPLPSCSCAAGGPRC